MPRCRTLRGVEIKVLGPLAVLDAEGQIVPLKGSKERELLARLVIASGEVVSVDRLVEDLWGDEPPANPENALQARVSRLRKSLAVAGGDATVVTRPPGYALDASTDVIDARRFERLVRGSRSAADGSPATLLSEALSLFDGEPFAEFAFHDWAQPEITRLEELRLEALQEQLAAELETGGDAETIGRLERLVEDFPLRERPRELLMLALYRAGRQADALEVYRRGRERLADELGIDPSPELQRLEQAILHQEPWLEGPARPAPVADDARLRPSLPARLTSFVGRREELRQLVELAGTHRLLTVTGPGGAGKTSLALEVARQVQDDVPAGAWMVDLSPVADEALVPTTIGEHLGVDTGEASDAQRALDRIAISIGNVHTLLLLDNCEHVVETVAATVDHLLRSCHGLSVIVTSREALGVPGEVLWATPPLEVPPEDAPEDQIVGSDAVRLFVERAFEARPDFQMDRATARIVADICRRLDGVPLALELAAARVRSLPVHEIRARLDDRFALLAGGNRGAQARQRTLRATVDWSYDLLADTERLLLARLAVFVGGWSLADAEAVCAGDGIEPREVLDLLTRLVDRSLVVAVPAAGRFSMLETIRAYAWERLEAIPGSEEVIGRHAQRFLEIAEEASPRHADIGRVRALEVDRGNLHAAFDRALERGDDETALRMATALSWFWFHGPRAEGDARMEAALARSTRSAVLRGRCLQSYARIHLFGPTAASMAAARESATLLREAGDLWSAARSDALVAVEAMYGIDVPGGLALLDGAEQGLVDAGDTWGVGLVDLVRLLVSMRAGDLAVAEEAGRRAVAVFRSLDDRWALTATLAHLGDVLRLRGADDDAGAIYEEARAIATDAGLPHTVQYVLTELGNLAALRGDDRTAGELLHDALRIARKVGNERGMQAAYDGVGASARRRGDLDRALEWHERARELYDTFEVPWSSVGLTGLGFTFELMGDLDEAHAVHRAALRGAIARRDVAEICLSLEGLGCVRARRGEDEPAAQLLDAAAAWRERTGCRGGFAERTDVERAASVAQDLHPAERGGVGDRADRATSLDEAAALVLGADGVG
jgi:predicted ATPase/DNA-binding SARP family transcriptional activator/tetratricopeptide (TPR) repeat protein